jgi:stress response protein SCP2
LLITGPSKLTLGLGWDAGKKLSTCAFPVVVLVLMAHRSHRSLTDVNLDASVIALNKKKEQIDIVSPNANGYAPRYDGMGLHHTGDNRSGVSKVMFSRVILKDKHDHFQAGKGDDEEIHIDLDKLSPEVHTLVFLVNSLAG